VFVRCWVDLDMDKRKKILVAMIGFFFSITSAQKTVAVLDFNSEGLKDISVSAIPLIVSREISKNNQYQLIERSAMKEILEEQGFQQSGCVSSECAVELGNLLGVEKMITGTISALGSLYIIEIRILDVATGKIENSEAIEHIGKIEDLLGPMKTACRKLITGVGEEISETAIYVKTKPTGAMVYLNGNSIGSSPIKYKTKAGNTTLNIKAQGYKDWTQTIIVNNGEIKIIDAEMLAIKSEVLSNGSSNGSSSIGEWEILGISRDEYIVFLRLGLSREEWLDSYKTIGISVEQINLYMSNKIPKSMWIEFYSSKLEIPDIDLLINFKLNIGQWLRYYITKQTPFQIISDYYDNNVPKKLWRSYYLSDIEISQLNILQSINVSGDDFINIYESSGLTIKDVKEFHDKALPQKVWLRYHQYKLNLDLDTNFKPTIVGQLVESGIIDEPEYHLLTKHVGQKWHTIIKGLNTNNVIFIDNIYLTTLKEIMQDPKMTPEIIQKDYNYWRQQIYMKLPVHKKNNAEGLLLLDWFICKQLDVSIKDYVKSFL